MTKGSKLCKADLHVHTPASHDYQDKGATATDVVNAAIGKELDLLAITDHNSAAFIDQARKAAIGTGVTIIPGLEVTTPEGHILALFNQDMASAEIADFLIQIGIPRSDHGKEEAISQKHAEDVIREVDAMGGLAIAAHANEKAIGLLQQKGQYKLRVVPMPELAALELTKREDIERFSKGQVSKDYPPKPCTQSSDAHSLADIGKRVTYLKMDERSIYGVRQALLDPSVRVRFSWDILTSSHPRICSLRVDQGFFSGQEFAFHENLNCLVGGQGTGKSTVIELLRYCFGDVSPFDHIADDHAGKIAKLVGDGGHIEVIYLDSDGDLKRVTREVQQWETGREVHDMAGNPTALLTTPVLFSQGELVETARNRLAQLELIDRHVDVSLENQEEQETLDALSTNARQIIEAANKEQKLIAEIDHPETGLSVSRAKHDAVKSKLADPVLQQFPKWKAEQTLLSEMADDLSTVSDAFDDAIDEIDASELEWVIPSDAPNHSILSTLNSITKDVAKALKKAKVTFKAEIASRRREVVNAQKQIQPKYDAEKAKHDALLAGLPQSDLVRATTQLHSIAKRVKDLEQKLGDRDKARARKALLEKERGRLLTRLTAARTARAKKRQAKAAEYQNALKGIVEVSIEAQGEYTAFFERLRDLSKGARILESDLKQLAHSMEPAEVAKALFDGDQDPLIKRGGLAKEAAGRFLEICSARAPDQLYELQVLERGDLPRMSYVTASGKAKPLPELSTGQKGTVIIALAMIEGPGPLVIDHPEEPLDTTSLYGQVVSKLRESKEARQFIFTTHNANIAVGADAELNHVLSASAEQGAIESSGAVDDATTNDLLLLHLEGGLVALTQRVKKYRKH